MEPPQKTKGVKMKKKSAGTQVIIGTRGQALLDEMSKQMGKSPEHKAVPDLPGKFEPATVKTANKKNRQALARRSKAADEECADLL
jgi:hypothetical protein